MPQQINLFSGTGLQGLPIPFHVPKSIDWKVAGCFAIVVGSLIFLTLRFMRLAPNNSLGHSTTGSPSLAGRIDEHPPNKETKLESREEGSSITPSTASGVKPSDSSPIAEGVETSASVPPRQVTKDGWTVTSVDGQVTVSFSMKSNDVIDITKQRVTERGGSVVCAFGGFKRWLKSEIFTLNGEEYYLTFRQNEEHIDEMRFSLEKTSSSNFTKAGPSSLQLKYVYKIGNNEPQVGNKPLDFSKEMSLTILTPRRVVRTAGENMITFTVTFLQPKMS
ncbi:MAG: hypothetical protein JSS10_04160 [Verrucomicrobia bacterium]|nr:hypothetical protein [Verrucomicrobiota bacterium]